ncbi:MAG: glycoside hydrolase family 13 protein [Clostridium perfringens]|nr:glycoside hydrolase family 13 protein [Clostridium perfringens]
MNKYGIFHVLDIPYSYGKDPDTLSVRIRTCKNDIKICKIYYKDRYDYTSPYKTKNMSIVAETNLFTYYETSISVKWNRYRYFFELTDFNNVTTIFTERGFIDEKYDNTNQKRGLSNTLLTTAFQFPYIAKEDIYEESKWLQEAVVYQIFPDRFCNGNSSINPNNTKPWEYPYIDHYTKFGGDIQGIINKLDYLKNLGITLIYLTPIFKSTSNHKYNTQDYFTIDSQFGSNELVRELVNKCHERNIKIIFDAVFNHSGDDFFAFKDVLKNQEHSKYKDWYFINEFPLSLEKTNYYTFGTGHRNMPKLNTNNPEVTKYLLDAGRFWVKEYGIDGWRLDVCDEVSHSFWKKFKEAIKKVNNDAVIIGEIMHEANNFLKGDQLDSIMNYPIKFACVDFFAKKIINAKEFLSILATNRMLYMESVNKQLLNLIGSHDTPRFLTECHDNIEKMKLAIVFQFTYIGVPYIYYGDEVGVNGGSDPQNRKCMIWDTNRQNHELLDFYKRIIDLRKNHLGFIHGNFKELYSENNILSYAREYNNEKYIVIINNNDFTESINFNNNYNCLNLMNNDEELICKTISLKSMEFKILKVLKIY